MLFYNELNDLDAALVALDTYRELSGVVSEEVLDTILQDLTRVLRERFDVVWEAARQYNNVEYVLDPTFVEALDSYNPANNTKELELKADFLDEEVDPALDLSEGRDDWWVEYRPIRRTQVDEDLITEAKQRWVTGSASKDCWY